jgi:hypothetical protein
VAEPSESDIDFAVINVDESKYNVKNGITDWSTADSDDLAKSTIEITEVGCAQGRRDQQVRSDHR